MVIRKGELVVVKPQVSHCERIIYVQVTMQIDNITINVQKFAKYAIT